ncbi:MAG TPA: thiamine-phosphate kinase [Methylocystis sp.]|nr:thiamine-phosphate kinase [Methylocystis sp.]
MPSRLTEDELIAKFFAPLAGTAGLNLADDAALLPAGNAKIVATADALVSGVHFFPADPPGCVARKALRVNLSDLAAKGAAPMGFLLTLALPADWTEDWLAAFAAGLAEDARDYGCPLLGGDTVATPGPMTISIAALGEAPQGAFVSRAGANAGDAILVSGTIGDAALGLVLRRDPALAARLSPASRDELLDRYLLPRPRLSLAPALRRAASAAMDVSDGLVGDLEKLARASSVGARAALDRIPLSAAAREAVALDPALLAVAVTGGDDYEILCCAADGAALSAEARDAGVALTQIGEIVAGPPDAVFLDSRGAPATYGKKSYSHF